MEQFLESFSHVIQKTDTLIIAVSGGVDSMVLLDLVKKHHPKEKILIAHFDHSLRGEESDGDREFIAKFCDTESLRFECEKIDIGTKAKDEKMSIEHAARKYRYDFLSRISRKYDARCILTAHHLDDRIETAIFNLIRGSKLGGIHALSRFTIHDSGCTIFRPLLRISKKEILEYAGEHGIGYREDSTNASLEYQRNYLRHELLPKFDVINPEYRKSLENFIEYSEELKSWIDSEVGGFLSDGSSFRVVDFEKKSLFFQREIIRFLYEKIHGGTVGLSERNIEEVIRFISDTVTPHAIKEIKNLRLERRKGNICYTSFTEEDFLGGV